MAVTQRDGLTFLDKMVGQAIDAALGKFFAAGLAGMLVAVASILEFLTSDKELEDELVGFATHGEERLRDGVCCVRARGWQKKGQTDSTGSQEPRRPSQILSRLVIEYHNIRMLLDPRPKRI